MRGSRRGALDLLLSLLPQGLSAAAGLAATLILARGLGPEGLGRYALVISVSSVVSTFTDLGIGPTAVRFASRALGASDEAGADRVFRWALRTRLVLALAAAAAAFAAAPLVAGAAWRDPSMTGLVRLGLSWSVLLPVATFPAVVLQARRRFGWNAIAASVPAVATFAAAVLAAAVGWWSVEAILALSAVALALAIVLLLPLVPWGRILRATAGHVEGLGSFASHNLVASIVNAVTARADVWLMGAFLPTATIGVYSAAMRFTMPLVMVQAAVATVLWPRAATAGSVDETLRLLRKTFRWSFGLAAGSAAYAIVVPLAAPWIFGPAYESAVGLGQVLSLRYALASLFCPIAIVGYNLGLIRQYVAMNVAQLVVVVAVTLALLPSLGAWAPAIALLCGETVGLALTSAIIARRLRQERAATAAPQG